MKQLLTGKQMKQADTWSIKEFGMESLILMERAALCAAQHIMSVQKPGCVFIMCGMGNNGADGLAMARILSQNGWSVRIAAIGQIEKATKEWLYQKALLDKMEILPVQYFMSQMIRMKKNTDQHFQIFMCRRRCMWMLYLVLACRAR